MNSCSFRKLMKIVKIQTTNVYHCQHCTNHVTCSTELILLVYHKELFLTKALTLLQKYFFHFIKKKRMADLSPVLPLNIFCRLKRNLNILSILFLLYFRESLQQNTCLKYSCLPSFCLRIKFYVYKNQFEASLIDSNIWIR